MDHSSRPQNFRCSDVAPSEPETFLLQHFHLSYMNLIEIAPGLRLAVRLSWLSYTQDLSQSGGGAQTHLRPWYVTKMSAGPQWIMQRCLEHNEPPECISMWPVWHRKVERSNLGSDKAAGSSAAGSRHAEVLLQPLWREQTSLEAQTGCFVLDINTLPLTSWFMNWSQ